MKTKEDKEFGFIKCDCGHYELKRVVVIQFGKTQCRDCARKNNAMLTKIVRQALGKKKGGK